MLLITHYVAHVAKPRFPSLSVHLWSDSERVLHWLGSAKPLKQFIANRTKEIKALFPVIVWNHCPTNENPADLLTRGITTTHLKHLISLAIATWSPVVTTCRAMASLEFLQNTPSAPLLHRLCG